MRAGLPRFTKIKEFNSKFYLVQLKGMPTKDQPTNCPVCNMFVKPLLCALNNCSWRYLGIKESPNGNEKIKSEWQEVKDHYYRFNEEGQVNWTSLVIETKYDSKIIMLKELN